MREQLIHEILMARQRVYAVTGPTPLERMPGLESGVEIFLKREDLSPVKSYKWRGAYNRMAVLTPGERERGVVAASAGNHAQGVALAARKLQTTATIFMPLSTPRAKREAVRELGGDAVRAVVTGDTYDDASAAAKACCAGEGKVYIHPYDDLMTMGGQGTLADEIVMSGQIPFDAAYLQIGGGGMAAAVATWLRLYWPGIRLIGVEGVDQASMSAAFAAGRPVALDYVDVFCDGTAVKQAGELTYPLCRDLLDGIVTVTNSEVSAAIQSLWETSRCIAEPAGAMGLAGLRKDTANLNGKRALVIVGGANLDFEQLAIISRSAGIGAARRRYFRIRIGEHPGELLRVLDTCFHDINIIEFQYGKLEEEQAWPVIGVEALPGELERFAGGLAERAVEFDDVTGAEDVEYRIIHYRARLMRHPLFIHLEFPERPGALRAFLSLVRDRANVCYFNYTSTGERVGRSLIGFEFSDEAQQREFRRFLPESGYTFREIGEAALSRIL